MFALSEFRPYPSVHTALSVRTFSQSFISGVISFLGVTSFSAFYLLYESFLLVGWPSYLSFVLFIVLFGNHWPSFSSVLFSCRAIACPRLFLRLPSYCSSVLSVLLFSSHEPPSSYKPSQRLNPSLHFICLFCICLFLTLLLRQSVYTSPLVSEPLRHLRSGTPTSSSSSTSSVFYLFFLLCH